MISPIFNGHYYCFTTCFFYLWSKMERCQQNQLGVCFVATETSRLWGNPPLCPLDSQQLVVHGVLAWTSSANKKQPISENLPSFLETLQSNPDHIQMVSGCFRRSFSQQPIPSSPGDEERVPHSDAAQGGEDDARAGR